MVPSRPTGLSKSERSPVSNGYTSGKSSRQNASKASQSDRDSKLGEVPRFARNSVMVKLRSALGSPISM